MDLLILMSVNFRNQLQCFPKRFLGECTTVVNVTVFVLVKYFSFCSHTGYNWRWANYCLCILLTKDCFKYFSCDENPVEGTSTHTLAWRRWKWMMSFFWLFLFIVIYLWLLTCSHVSSQNADKSGFLLPEFGWRSLELLFPEFLSEGIKIPQAVKLLMVVLWQPKQWGT